MRRPQPIALLVALLAVAGSAAWGQDDPVPAPAQTEPDQTQDDAAPAEKPEEPAQTPAAPITLEQVRERLAALEPRENEEDFTDEERQRLEAYRKAQAFLLEVVRSEEQRKSFAAALARAPAEREAAEAKLAEPAPALEPEGIPEDPTLAQLQAGFDQASKQLEAVRKEMLDLDDGIARRDQRGPVIREGLARDQQRLDVINGEIGALPLAGDSPELTTARRVELESERLLLMTRIAAYQAEQANYEARRDVAPLRREQLARRVGQLEGLVTAWQGLVESARAADILRQQREAADAAARAHPMVAPIAEQNAELAATRDRYRPLIEQSQQALAALPATPEELTDQLRRLRERVESVGLTPTVGLVLRKARAELPDPAEHQRAVRDRQVTMAEVEFLRLDLEDQYRDLVDKQERIVQDILAGMPANASETQRDAVEREAREQLRWKREYLSSLNDDLTVYFDNLEKLNSTEEALVTATREIASYIDERILWIRSSQRLQWSDRASLVEAVKWMFSAEAWGPVFAGMRSDTGFRWVPPVIALMIVVALLATRRRLQWRIRKTADDLSRATTDTFGRTVLAAACTLARAAIWPLAMYAAGRLLITSDKTGEVEMAQAAGFALTNCAFLLFVLQLMTEICQARGLGEAHFRWRPQNLAVARRNLQWLTWILVPLAVVIIVIQRQEYNEAFKSSLGRVAFIPTMLALSLFMERMLRPGGGIVRDYLTRHRGGWVDRLKYVWFPLALLVPIALAIQSFLGFHFTAVHLAGQVIDTGYFLVGLTLLHGLALRWLVVAQRRLALEEARRRRAAYEERLAREEESPGDSLPPVEETAVDVSAISAQAKQLVRGLALFLLLMGLWVIWADALPALGFLRNVELWQGAVEATAAGEVITMINLEDLLIAGIIVVVTIIVSKNIPGLLEITILQKLPLEPGSRYAISTILRYTLTIVGFVIAFAQVGVTWQKVQFLAAAITVGLGFGLQEIFGNFVSGLIILFERPIRVGDTVTVGEVHGTVSQIRIRSTTIIDWDRKELVIPNKEFVTGTIMNWTLSDPILRVVVPVGIAYGSDTALAEKLLLQVAADHPMVLKEPVPTVLFSKFGDSALEFNLRVFINNIDQLFRVRHELHNAVDQAFRKAGIVIAFPQRDLHLVSVPKSGPGPVPAQIEESLGDRGAREATEQTGQTVPRK